MPNAGKKFILSLAVIVGFVGYAWRQRHGDEAGAITANPSTAQQTSDNSNVSTLPPVDANTSTDTTNNQSVNAPSIPTAPQPTTGQYRNGSFTGSVTDAFYGNVQVRAKISGGKITAVDFLQYPHDRNTSVYINSQAMPLLQQEAIQAQSADVSGVSGASATSQAFVESLQTALDQARP